MKAETRIRDAAMMCYVAYCDYSRIVLKLPVLPKTPKVDWMPGNPKGGNAGWVVDGHLYPGTADVVVNYFHEQTERWEGKTKRKSEPVSGGSV